MGGRIATVIFGLIVIAMIIGNVMLGSSGTYQVLGW
jgi:hypothetical protein